MPSPRTGKSKTEVETIIPFPLYSYRVYVIFTQDLVKTADNLAKKGYLSKNHGIDDTTAGYHIRMPNQSFTFVVLKPNSSINQITHECYHALVGMFRWIGAAHEEEIFAYHLGYMVGLVVKDQEKARKVLDKGEK